MSKDFAAPLPIDKRGTPYQTATPQASAIARYVSENAIASSVISVTHDTTAVEIAAVGSPVFMRWVATSDTQASVIGIAGATANFDHVIPANTFRRFVIPIDNTAPTPPVNSLVGANRANQLYQRFAWKSSPAASVFGSEFQ